MFVMRPLWGKNGSSERPPNLGLTGLLKCSLPAGLIWVPQRAELTIMSMWSGFPCPARHTGSPGHQHSFSTWRSAILFNRMLLTVPGGGGVSHAALCPPRHLAFLPVLCHLQALKSQHQWEESSSHPGPAPVPT